MLNVLINAYAVSPSWGSEQGMGWNWVINIARYCNIYVITEGEWREEIEDALKSLPQKENIHFYYNPVSDKVRKMCWNQGDWRFYYHYRKWQKKTLKIARRIISENDIDVIHQLNMIGFREPGYFWKIKDIPFVWGPIGGMELLPIWMLKEESVFIKSKAKLKNCINDLQRKYQPNVINALNNSSALCAATSSVQEFIRRYHKKEVLLLNETGCYPTNKQLKIFKKDTFDILWVGKYDYRKQLWLALEVISNLKDHNNIILHIVGSGSVKESRKYCKKANELNLQNNIKWYGQISHSYVLEMMKNSDLLLFTSIMEGTPHVVLEALQNNLPVICFDCCGQGNVIDEMVGRKIPLSDRKQAILDFTNAIEKLYNNPQELVELRGNCNQRQQELSWEWKANKMVELYCKALIENHRKCLNTST